MESLKQLLIILCTWQFIVGPVAFAGDLTGDTALQAERDACTGATVEWNSQLNTCVTKAEVIDTKNQTDSCANSEDPESCYMANAEEKTGVKKGQNGNNDTKAVEVVAKTVAAAYSLYSMVSLIAAGDRARTEIRDRSSCTSKKIFGATSIAWIAGDLLLKAKAKKNFKSLAEKYAKEQSNEENKGGDDSSYQSQVRAFTYLKEEQEQVKKQAKLRVMLQTVTVVGYTAAMILGIKEAMKAASSGYTNLSGYCRPSGDYDNAEQLSATNLGQRMFKTLGSSEQVAFGAALMLTTNAFLIGHAHREKTKAEDRITDIDDIIATYSEYIAGFCPDGREDLTNERCYCYMGDGTQNENRSQSVICQNLFASDTINYSLINAKPLAVTEGPRQGCVTVTGQFDSDCKCRSMINSTTKQNACANTPATTAINSGFAAQIGAGDALKTLNTFPQGANNALANLNQATLTASAAKSKKIGDSFLKQAKKEGFKFPPQSVIDEQAKKLMFQANKNPRFAGASRQLGVQRGNSIKQNPALSKAIKKAESRVKLTPTFASTGTGKGATGSKNKGNAFKFNWNDTAAKQGNQVKTFMEKKYKYKGSDIVKRNDVSLWNVISRRYQTSGLKRLFGDEEDE